MGEDVTRLLHARIKELEANLRTEELENSQIDLENDKLRVRVKEQDKQVADLMKRNEEVEALLCAKVFSNAFCQCCLQLRPQGTTEHRLCWECLDVDGCQHKITKEEETDG